MLTSQIDINLNKVAIYVRWSTDEQTQGTTLETQLNACKNYILSQGWNVNEDLIFIDDGYTGANLKRPDMTKLRHYIKEEKIDCIIVYKLDRLSRNLKDAVNLVLDEWMDICYLKSVTEPIDTTTPLGKQIFYILFGFAEMERELIKERTWGGKLKRAEEGKNPGFTLPYGYIHDKNNSGKFYIIEEERVIVNKIYDLYLQGKGCRAIAEILNNQNIKFRKNKSFSQSTISYILLNPLYYGCLQYGRSSRNHKRDKGENEPYWIKNEKPLSETLSDFIEPIISKEKWDKVQELRESKNVKNSRISGRTYSSPYLLTGLLFCKKCNHGVGGYRVFSKNKELFYYQCRGYMLKGKGFCDGGYSPQMIVDLLVMDELKEDFIPEVNRKQLVILINEKNQQNIEYIEKSNIQIENQIKDFSKQLLKLEKDYLNGDLSAKIYNNLEQKISIDKVNSELQFKENIEILEKLKTKIINKEDIDIFANALDNWDVYSIEEKKMMLKKWIYKVLLYKKNKEITCRIIYIWDKERD